MRERGRQGKQGPPREAAPLLGELSAKGRLRGRHGIESAKVEKTRRSKGRYCLFPIGNIPAMATPSPDASVGYFPQRGKRSAGRLFCHLYRNNTK